LTSNSRWWQRWGQVSHSPIFLNGLLLVGALLRIRQYLANRSLWLDESMLALNVVGRSFADLLKPLDYSQAAPLGFLLLVKAATQVAGQGEYGLRLIPLLLGIISLPLFYKVARDLLIPAAVPLAVALFAILVPFTYYSSELKQYSGDVMVVLLLLAAAYPPPASGTYSLPRAVGLVLVGGAAVWLSHPAVFTLAAIGVVLLLPAMVRRPRQNAASVGLIAASWLASFAATYYLSLRSIAANPVLSSWWSQEFVPPPVSKAAVNWWLNKFVDGSGVASIFADPAAFRPAGVALFAFLVGCAFMFVHHRQRFWLLTSPLLFVLAASALGRYPFAGRLLLFVVPLLVLLVAYGAGSVIQTAGRSAPAVGVILVGLLLFPVVRSADNAIAPEGREEIKPVLGYVARNRQPGDLVYVHFAARPAFDFYAPRYAGFPEVVAGSRMDDVDYVAIESDLERLRHRGRVWILLSHTGQAEEDFFVAYLDRIGKRVDAVTATGASAYLYDLGARGGMPPAVGRP